MSFKYHAGISALIIMVLTTLTSCFAVSESATTSYNLNQREKNFNLVQRLTVINLRTDTVILQVEGNFRAEKDSQGDLKVVGRNPITGEAYQHYVSLPNEVVWLTEQLENYEVPRGFQLIIRPTLATVDLSID